MAIVKRIAGAALVLLLVVLALPRVIAVMPGGSGPAVQNPLLAEVASRVTAEDFLDLDSGLSGAHPITVGGEQNTLTTRYTPSAQGTLAEQYVYEYFRSLGLSTAYHDWTGVGRCLSISGRNIIAEIPGKVDPSRVYIMAAHVDSTGPDLNNAPGADDNASGTTAVMLAARILRSYTFDYTLRFVIFTGEERGLCGSHEYARGLRERNEDVQGALDLDMIAYDSDGVRDVEIHAGTLPGSKPIADSMVSNLAAFAPSLVPHVYLEDSTGRSDQASFWSYGYPAILGIEYFLHGDMNPYYHSVQCCDTIDHVDVTMGTGMAKAGLATMAGMAGISSGQGNATATPTRTATPVPTVQIPGSAKRFFTETGQSVSGRFLDYWESNGGLPQQGFPISTVVGELSLLNGKPYTVQYFERAVFEYHPENRPPFDVLLSQLGAFRYKETYPSGRPSGVVGQQARQGTCTATHDDSDAGVGAGFTPDAPVREVVGSGFVLTGRVLSSRDCAPIAGAKLEMRPEINNEHPEAARATLHTDTGGHYRFESNFPEHIHMQVSAHGFKTIIANGYHTSPGKSIDSFDIVLVPDPSCRFFAETGQSLCGTFLNYWNRHGGLAQQGFPISDEFTEVSDLDRKPYRVQYFERAVFELHPENAAPYDVLLSLLGTLQYREKSSR